MILERSNNSEIIQNLPKDLKDLFLIIQKELPILFPDIFIGIYVYGSISYDAFDPNRSDVDVVAVIKNKFNEEEIQKLRNWYQKEKIQSSKWIRRLEMDFVTLENVSSNVHNNTEVVHFAGNKLKENSFMDGAVIEWENLRSCGIILYGKDPSTFIPEINKDLLFEALIDKFKNLKKNIPNWMKIDLWNQVFIVVQLCRVVYALENDGKPISKEQATLWCKNNLPFKFKEMIEFVLDNINAGSEPIEEIISKNLPDFLGYVDNLFLEKISLVGK